MPLIEDYLNQLTEDEKKKVIELYEVGKTAEADDLIEKVLERQVGVPGTTETIMTQNFISFKKNRLCSSHPHNYYLELLSESGIIGAVLIIIFFLILLKDSFYYLKKFHRLIFV